MVVSRTRIAATRLRNVAVTSIVFCHATLVLRAFQRRSQQRLSRQQPHQQSQVFDLLLGQPRCQHRSRQRLQPRGQPRSRQRLQLRTHRRTPVYIRPLHQQLRLLCTIVLVRLLIMSDASPRSGGHSRTGTQHGSQCKGWTGPAARSKGGITRDLAIVLRWTALVRIWTMLIVNPCSRKCLIG